MLRWLKRIWFCRILDLPDSPTGITHGPYYGIGDALDNFGFCKRCRKLVIQDRSYSTGSLSWYHIHEREGQHE